MRTFFNKTILFLLIFHVFLFGRDYKITVLENTYNEIRLNVTFNKPQLVDEEGMKIARYSNTQHVIADGNLLVPKVVKFFNLPFEGEIKPRINSIKWNSEIVKNYFTVKAEKLETISIASIASSQYLGKRGSIPVHVLYIYPVRYDKSTSSLSWIESMEVEVAIPKSNQVTSSVVKMINNVKQFTGSLFINNKNEIYKPGEISGLAKSTEMTARINPILDKQNIFKLIVKKTGIYKITYDDLLAADYPIESVNPRRLSLFYKGVEVPIYFKGSADEEFNEGDFFEFWGKKNEKTLLDQFPDQYSDPFSDESVYWLVENTINGRRLVEENGALIQSGSGPIFEPFSFTETLHFESDKYIDKFGKNGSYIDKPTYYLDQWYFDSGISAPEGGAYDFYVPSPYEYGTNVIISAAFRGKSYKENEVNELEGHKVDLKLRGKEGTAKRVGIVNPQDKWRDQYMKIISNADSTIKLSQSLLNDGINRLEVDMFQTGVSDIVFLNWFEITYLRKYIAYQNKLKFSVDESFFNNQYIDLGDPIRFNLNGFSNNQIDLYKIGISKITNGLIKQVQENRITTYRLSFQDEVFDTDVQYIAVTDNAKLKPVSINPYNPWINEVSAGNLLDENNAAEYLIITDNLLYTTCNRLKELKEAAGYKTEIVTVENIYDVFNYGVKSPIAIKEFIKYAAKNWNNTYPLQYAVFVGDASYDYKSLRGSKTDFVPTFMYQTVDFGATGSDYWYALFDDDYIPDVSVSRIPASSNQQLNNYIDKIENYTQNNEIGPWRNSALFISGRDDSGADLERLTNRPIFRAQSLRLIDMQLPDHIFSNQLNTIKDETAGDFDPNFGSTTDLIEYFDDGVTFINFLGHGGGNIWADVNLLNLNDIERLNNGSRLPFIASMTCFTGAFENPGKDGLAERLILSENKGAIAILASSGFGWKYNDMAIEWGLFEFLWDDLTFGQAVDLMKIYYLANPIYYTENGDFYTFSYYTLQKTMVSQYNLLGDPALKLQKPQETLDVSVENNSPLPGDSIKVAISGGPASGSGRLEVVNRKNLLIHSDNFVHQNSGIEIQFMLADTLASDLLTLKVYVTDGTVDASGSLEVGLGRSVIKSITSSPLNPKVGESISFQIEIASNTNIESIKLYNFRDFNNLKIYNFNITTRKISETLFESDIDLPGFTTAGVKLFDILVKDSTGVEQLYRWRKLTIYDGRPDLKIVENTLAYTGTSQLQVKFAIENDSEENLSDVALAAYTDNGIVNNMPFAESLVSLESAENKTVILNFDSTTFKENREFKIVLDPQNLFAERDEDNNILQKQLSTDHILIEPAIGTTINGSDNDTITFNNKWKFFVARDTISQPTVVKFTEINIFQKFEEISQKELIPIHIAGHHTYLAAEISVGNFTNDLNFNANLRTQVNTTIDSLSNLSYYYYDEFLDLWVQTPSNLNGNILDTQIEKPGLYSIFYNSDDKDPYIEISSNGRPLYQDFLVVRRPIISILLQDESGVNLNNSFTLRLDDQILVSNGLPLNADAVNYPDSLENSKSISILATPELEAGEHTLSVDIADVNGNYSSKEVAFKVSAEFDIEVYGNYPNPFKDQTVISYFINSDNILDKFYIKIYTTSGRLIRSKSLDIDESLIADPRDPYLWPDYHELIWNGDDDDGNQVANGVYYAIIKGTYKGKTITKTLKIARLQ